MATTSNSKKMLGATAPGRRKRAVQGPLGAQPNGRGKHKPAFSHPVYEQEAAYEAAVTAFVAQVQAGTIQVREPDED